MAIQFGKANYSGSNESKRLTYFKLGHKKPEQRTVTVRIAPPYGALAERGTWAVYLKQHWGYTLKVVGGDGKARDIPVTFNCCEKTDRNGNITVHCAECDAIRLQKDTLKSKKEELAKAGKTEEEVTAATQYVAGWLKAHNCDRKWHLAAKDINSVWGFFQCSHAAYKFLKSNNPTSPGLIDKLLAKGVDPLAPEKGLWFKWTRHGTDFNEIRDVPEIFKEEVTVDGETMERIRYDALTQSDLDALEKLPALDTLGRDLTPDQIKMIVDSGGEEDIIRTCCNMPKQQNSAKAATASPAVEEILSDEPEDEPVAPAAAPVAVAPKATPAALPAVPSAQSEEDAEEAALAAQMAALAARKAAKAKAAAAAVVTPAAAPKAEVKPGTVTPKLASQLEEEDMEAFMAKYNK
jgi:hypothetical protein